MKRTHGKHTALYYLHQYCYIYDSANRMVKGTNAGGVQSHYICNGFGHLVSNEWIIKSNAYGYTNITMPPSAQVNGTVLYDRHGNSSGSEKINPAGKGFTTGGTTGGIVLTIDAKNFKRYALCK
jgi:YD repeat-containing protein